MRLAAAIGVLAVAVGAAVYLDQRRVSTYEIQGDCLNLQSEPIYLSGGEASCSARGYTWRLSRVFSGRSKPSWEDPVAVLVLVGGVVFAAGILSGRPGSRLANPC